MKKYKEYFFSENSKYGKQSASREIAWRQPDCSPNSCLSKSHQSFQKINYGVEDVGELNDLSQEKNNLYFRKIRDAVKLRNKFK